MNKAKSKESAGKVQAKSKAKSKQRASKEQGKLPVRKPKGTPFSAPSPNRDEAMQALQNGMEVKECTTRFGISRWTARRYLKKIKKKEQEQQKPVSEPDSTPQNQTEKVKQAAKPSETLVHPGQEATLAAVTITKPAPITFTLGEAKIPLNPQYLYDAYLYYQDIQRMSPDIDDEFCLGIKTAMKYVWEKFVRREANKIGVGIKEG